MITRENVKLVAVAVACLLIAWTGPSLAHGVHAQFAHNSAKVDGKDAVGAGASRAKARGKLVAHNRAGRIPAKFLPASVVTEAELLDRHAQIITTHDGSGWRMPSSNSPGSFNQGLSEVAAQSNGDLIRSLDAPFAIGPHQYGLSKIEICFKSNSSAIITEIQVQGAEPAPVRLATDSADRASTTPTCSTVPVGTRAPRGAGVLVRLAGAGTVTLYGVRAFWTRSAATVPPPAG